MNQPNLRNLFDQLMEINRQAFAGGLYDAAYHALESAFYCAKEISSNEPLILISRVAQEEIEWIDGNAPDYEHSTASTRQRGMNRSIYLNLSEKVRTILRGRDLKKGL